MATNIFAIRWDGNYSRGGDDGPFFNPARYTQRMFYPLDLQGIAPLHADIINNYEIRYNPTVAALEAEVALAASADINWSFLMYGRAGGTGHNYTPGNMEAFDLYQQTTGKNNVPWSAVSPACLLGTAASSTAQRAEYLGYFQQTNYKKLAGNRPVLKFLFLESELLQCWNNVATFNAAISQLSASAVAAGLGEPYIVVLGLEGTVQRMVDFAVSLNADCVGAYFLAPFPQRVEGSYEVLTSNAVATWNEFLPLCTAAGIHFAPTCMTGWNGTARHRRTGPWNFDSNHEKMSLRYAAPTPAQFAAHVQSALNFCNANPTICPHDMVMIYAWSEYDEAGTVLAATKGNPTATHLAAMAAITNP